MCFQKVRSSSSVFPQHLPHHLTMRLKLCLVTVLGLLDTEICQQKVKSPVLQIPRLNLSWMCDKLPLPWAFHKKFDIFCACVIRNWVKTKGIHTTIAWHGKEETLDCICLFLVYSNDDMILGYPRDVVTRLPSTPPLVRPRYKTPGAPPSRRSHSPWPTMPAPSGHSPVWLSSHCSSWQSDATSRGSVSIIYF